MYAGSLLGMMDYASMYLSKLIHCYRYNILRTLHVEKIQDPLIKFN